MDDIYNIQDDNLGGLKLIRFAPWNFFTDRKAGVFVAGRDWISVECTKETMLFSERRVDDANGGYLDVVISGSVPQIRPEVALVLQKYALQPVIVECEDNNDRKRRAGTSGRLIIVDQANTGTDAADLNGYLIQFAGKQLNYAPFL